MKLSVVENGLIRLGFSAQSGLPVLLENSQSGMSYIRENQQPFWKLTFKDQHGEKFVWTAADASSAHIAQTPDGLLIYYNFVGMQALSVRCTVDAQKDGSIRFGITVDNVTRMHLESVEYPCFVLPSALSSVQEDWILYTHGFYNGILMHGFDSAYTKDELQWDGSFVEPIQMVSAGCANEMLYFATSDDQYYAKHLQPTWLGDGMKISNTHFIDEENTRVFTLPYPAQICLLDSGDWRDAALRYREWAQQQWWCEKRLDERDDLPEWWLKSPVVLSIKERAKRNSDPQQRKSPWCHPLPKGLPRILDVADKLESKVNVQVFHWEQNGAFVNPDHFPPLSGWDGTRAFFDGLHEKGHYGGLYILPLRWCFKATTTDYDGSEYFLRTNALEGLALNEQLKPIPSRWDWEWRKRFSACAASEPVQKEIIDSFHKISDLGADYIQFDTFNGVLYDCWSDQHGHYPGRGRWQIGESIELVKKCRDTGHPYVFTVEASPVPELMPYVHGFVERGIQPTAQRNWDRVPMFQFIYHPYCQAFAGEAMGDFNTVDNFFMLNAMTIVNGDMLMVNLDEEGKYAVITHEPDTHNVTLDREIPDTDVEDFLRRQNHLRRDIAGDFLICGQMERTPDVECELGKILEAEQHTFKRIPAVLAQAWSNRAGQQALVVSNYTDKVQKASFADMGLYTMVMDNDQTAVLENIDGRITIELPPRTSAIIR